MAIFTTRVEMHGATGEEYERLHELLASYGFNRTIEGVDDDGRRHTYALPTAEYNSASAETAATVRRRVQQLAATIRKDPWVLVTEATNRSWNTKTIN